MQGLRQKHLVRTNRRAVLKAAAGGAAVVAGGISLSGREAYASQPRQSGVTVYPVHDTRTASPNTEISFRGIAEELLGLITVQGSKSGIHSGIVVPHSDGNGVSFVPDAGFQPGEEVTVQAETALRGADDGSLSFIVAQPAPTVPPRTNDEEDESSDERQSFRTRPDLQPPPMNVTTEATNTAPGLVFLGAKIREAEAGAMILDNSGGLVWFNPEYDVDYMVNDVRVQEYQGEPVITWSEAAAPLGHGLGHFVMVNSAYERIAQVQVANGYPGGDVHEFILTPRGTALYIIYHAIQWDLRPIGGGQNGAAQDNIVQELDLETGRVVFEWHSLDHIAVEESYRDVDADGDRPYDYFHMNSVEEVDDDTLVISARHSYGIYRVDRRSGDVRWRLGGKQSDFELGEGVYFAWQHDARLHANGELTLFDNAEGNQDSDKRSRGVVLDLDEETMAATLVREYIHPTEILSVSQGNLQRLSNGNVFIGWGNAPVFSEFSQDGDLLFNARFPTGGNSYRAYRFPWSGQPATPPDIAAERGTTGDVSVYASWNGATEVATWRVLAGPSPDQLFEVGSAPRSGFETTITVQTAEPYVAVEALNAAGNILGSSEAIEAEA